MSEITSLVLQIVTSSTTYYLTERTGITLDGTTYKNLVESFGTYSSFGNIGNGQNQIGYGSKIILANGEEFLQNGYYFNPADSWNNSRCIIKKWYSGDSLFANCKPIASGLIKSFQIDNEQIHFTLDLTDRRDEILIPGVICSDQSDMDDGEALTGCYKLTSNTIKVDGYELFTTDELVMLTTKEGEIEFARIKSMDLDEFTLYDNLLNSTYDIITFNDFIEKPFRNLPKKSAGKTIPIQIGDLSSILGKTITINEKIGNQKILVDTGHINTFTSVGIYDKSYEEYWAAKQDSKIFPDSDQLEYDINNNFANFMVEVLDINLGAAISVTDQGLQYITVTDWEKLTWLDETNSSINQRKTTYIVNPETDNIKLSTEVSEFLSINIIGIDNELMLLVEKPVSNSVLVERGYQATSITAHANNAKIYQSSKFSVRNLLVFTERFMSNTISNYKLTKSQEIGLSTFTDDADNTLTAQNYHIIHSTTGDGKTSNVLNESSFQHKAIGKIDVEDITVDENIGAIIFTYDLRFKNVDKDLKIIGWYPASHCKITLTPEGGTHSGWELAEVGIYDPDARILPDLSNVERSLNEEIDGEYLQHVNVCRVEVSGGNAEDSEEKDYYTENDPDTKRDFINFNYGTSDEANLNFPTLKSLNKKFKIAYVHWLRVYSGDDDAKSKAKFEVKKFGFWIDFAANFTEENIMSSIKGREVSTTVNQITGESVDSVIEVPINAIAEILTMEMQYTASDFMTANWTALNTYYNTFDPTPYIHMSYGREDRRKKGMKFCQEIAYHFNLQITKTEENKLDLVSIYQIYNNTPTSYEIPIEHILFIPESGKKRSVLKHTGTDLLYNDIVVKYYRNNDTNEYQKVYTLPENYIIPLSNISLLTARGTYYNGRKRTLEIESSFIYNEIDAERFAQTIVQDSGEVHFFMEIYLPFEHYVDHNSLSNQYYKGQIIHFTGENSGVSFTSDNKFYVQNVLYTASSREVKLLCKSLQSVKMFNI